MCRVKLAVDLKTKQEVAIKILKVKEGRAAEFSKEQSLDGLFSEISILADCDHKNVVKIKAASFDGVIVKMLCAPGVSNTESLSKNTKSKVHSSSSNGSDVVTRQLNDMKLAPAESVLLAEEDRLEALCNSVSSDEDGAADDEPIVVKR